MIAERKIVFACVLLGLELGALSALAQDKTTVAEALFREGRELMAHGNLDAACPKLAESQRLDPSSGTLLNLADCHEKQGRVATAWAEFLAAARLAQTQNRPERVDEAKQRAKTLEAKLSYLTIVLSERLPGISVKIDDTVLEASVLGSKIPVDPGTRKLTISAPDRQTLELSVTVGASGDRQTVTIPKLEPTPSTATHEKRAPKPPPEKKVDRASNPSGPPVAAYVIGGAGVVALGVGTAFGFMAKSAYGDADRACPSHVGCSSEAMDLRSKANTRANIANIGVGLGVIGIGVGAVLFFTHDSGKRENVARAHIGIAPFVGPERAGIGVEGALF